MEDYILHFEELNKQQLERIKKDIVIKEYEWEEKHLANELLGFLIEERELYKYKVGKELSEKEKRDNDIINRINVIIKKYNSTLKENENIKKELETEYNLLGNETELYLNKDIILSRLNYEKTILITGPGGIGKSQYIYSIYKKALDVNYKKLFIYGKYSEEINDIELTNILNEIKKVSQNEKVLFVIDAINEFDIKKRNIIYNFLEKKNTVNLRIIVTCRDFSLDSSELDLLISLVDEQIPFSGVDIIDSIQKISEECNIDLTKYEDLLYDNNPLHLKMIKNIISNNRLENKDCNSIVIGTDIYEQYIKNTTKKYDINKNKYWDETKELVKYMVDNDVAFPTIDTINQVLQSKSTDYLKVMTNEGFIDINGDTIIFRNETLHAYLIARDMFERLPDKAKDIIDFLNQKLQIFYFVHEQLIIMLFDKLSNMKKIANIIRDTDLQNYFGNIKFLNRIKFSKANRKQFIKIFNYNGSIETALFEAGGFENNPLNCVNYLNKKIFKLNTNFNFNYSKVDIRYAKAHLISWIRTIATFECSNDYIEEKFWFALWCSSLVNKDVRYLSRKLIFEITQKYNIYIEKLKKIYMTVEDEYIKEAIIQVLCSQSSSNLKVKRFINKINNDNLLNFRSLYYISKYLFGNEIYTSFNKVNLLKIKCSRNKNKNIYDFLKHVLFIHKEEYNMLALERYKNKIKYHQNFISEDKNKINKINIYIRRYWKCKTACYYESEFKQNILYNKFNKINENLLKDFDIYFTWQEIFKKELKKYGIKYKDLKDLIAYEEEDKNIAYKALEIANNKVLGSLVSNYYSSDFKLNGESDDGYLVYRFESHASVIDLNSPITIFSEDIEKLNNRIIKSVEIPKNPDEINLEWANNKELSLRNFKNIITPIKYKGKNWILIYGSVKVKEESKHEIKWSDEYIINMAINEIHTLKQIPDIDRKYTIETKSFDCNILDYSKQNYTQTCSLKKHSFWDNFFIESDFNLPPSQIVKEFGLTYNNNLSAWIDANLNIVLLASNNQDSWYKHGVTGSIYIEESYYKILEKKYNLKFFAFTERFYQHYRDESSLQIEYINNDNITYYLHYKANREEKKSYCKNCKVYKIAQEKEKKRKNNKLNKFLYNIINDLSYEELKDIAE